MPERKDLIEKLSRRLQRPLPGRAAQERFAPAHCQGQHFGAVPADARAAAVMMLLYPAALDETTTWRLPLTLRPDHMKDHAGQVSLPGGTIETNESPATAALRELREELHVESEDIQVLGTLTPIYLYVSNFHVTPVLAWTTSRPNMKPNPNEVAELIELELHELLGPGSYGQHTIATLDDAVVPHIVSGDHNIWGATAIMLGELAAVIRGV